jgi:hypothetical protein
VWRAIGVAVALALVALSCVSMLAASAVAVAPGPAFRVQLVARPTVFSAQYNGTGVPDMYQVIVTNSGSRPTDGSPVTVSDELPPGETLAVIKGAEGGPQGQSVIPCEAAFVSCSYGAPLQPGEGLIVQVAVNVAPGVVGPLTDAVRVSGGGAPSASANVATAVGSLAESTGLSYGVANFTAETTGVDGLMDVQAGDHPYETTVSFDMNSFEVPTLFRVSYESAGGLNGQPAHTKDTIVDVPPGFVGDPNVVEKCPLYKVVLQGCPPSTQIGYAIIAITENAGSVYGGFGGGGEHPIYNVVPDRGYPAEFVIDFAGIAVPLYVSVTPDSGNGVRVTTPGIPRIGSPIEVSATFFGTPSTDANVFNGYRTAVSGATPVAFLDNPVDCSTVAQQARLIVDSWERPGSYLADGQPNLADANWKTATTTMFPSLSGCELLQFDPSLYVTPDTTRADEPAGITVDLAFPQAPQEFPHLITPELKNTVVTLPSGVSISPSAGDGLAGCTNAQIDLASPALGACPDGSQIGTALVTTPLLNEPLHGQVYLGTPSCDPCTNADASDGNMFRLFLQIEGAGVVVKLEGHVYANTTTGQLTTRFANIPQLPVSDAQLHFNSGLRAALATPQSCGVFTSTADLTPYSSPVTPDATPESQLNVDWNGNGEACPGVWPFRPGFEAGTSNPNAGQLSPLTVTFNREDREQDFAQIKVTTPPGLLGSLSGVPLCGEPQADLGTCSAASQIGEMTVAAGPGSHPYYQKGMVYLTGPYKGAPFGLSIVTPTRAGPFNLGNVVVRATINVDPHTTALTVTTDPLPQILDGIPLRLRKTNVTINRPGFIFNPTDCAQLHITATISGSQGTQSEASAPFAVSGCAGLPFAPKFSVYTSGKPSRLNGTSLDARLVFGPGPQSNIAHVKVELPRQLPSRLPTLQKACPAGVFEANPARCPAASVIGAAKAITPVMPVPLRGPVYFVSHGGEAFPNLVTVLQGYGVRVDLIGDTHISKTGITSSTFTNVPDVPVSSFELFLPQGPYSALTAVGNPCRERLVMPTVFTAQDGAQLKQNTPIQVTGCPRAARAARARKAPRAGRISRAARTRHERSRQ